MITMLGRPRRLCDGLTRRETLKAGALSLLGGAFNLPSLLAAEENRAADARPGKAKSVILLYLLGGAPTQDMFDLKPERAGEDPRRVQAHRQQRAGHGDLRAAAAHGAAGCTRRPWSARSTTRRAATTRCPATPATRSRWPDITSTKDTYPPSMGSVCEYLPQASRTTCPPTSTCPITRARAMPAASSAIPGLTPVSWASATTRSSPSSTRPSFAPSAGMKVLGGEPFLSRNSRLADGITLDALQTREGLLQQFNRQQRRLESDRALDDLNRIQQRALSLLTSHQAQVGVRPRARSTPSCATATTAPCSAPARSSPGGWCEAGVRFVNVTWDFPGDNSWDTHADNFNWLRGRCRRWMPRTAPSWKTWKADGLLDETLVVLMSDMGRTPQVNANAGRDHWTYCYTRAVRRRGHSRRHGVRRFRRPRRLRQGAARQHQRHLRHDLPMPGHRSGDAGLRPRRPPDARGPRRPADSRDPGLA